MSIVTAILTLVGGIGIFLTACGMMSANLTALGTQKLKSLFGKAQKSKLAGVGVGALVTAVVQSSSATTVMVLGFVDAGIMTLAQAATVIFGANIGTTVTGQLVALGLFGSGEFSVSAALGALAGVGALISALSKTEKAKSIGGLITGFGMLFAGLAVMSGAMDGFSRFDGLKSFLATFENPIMLVIVGALLTAVVQSSSVMTSMVITMTVSGLITAEQGIYITMGSNVGTCVTALLAGLSGGINAKRAALIHLIFNVSGVVLFMIAGAFMRLGGTGYAVLFSAMFPDAPQMQLAAFHTVFNVVTAIAVLPFVGVLVKLVEKPFSVKRKSR